MADVQEPKAFAAEALQRQDLLDAKETRLQEVKKLHKQAEKKLEALEKAIGREKNQTVSQRREGALSTFVQQKKQLDAQQKEVSAAREKARTQGVKARIAEQTEALCKQAQELQKELRLLIKNSRAPGICRSRLYYILFWPKGAAEHALWLLFFLLVFILLPVVINLCIPGDAPWHWALVYAADVLLFGGAYLRIFQQTRGKHAETIKRGRELQSAYTKTRKEIRNITKRIRRDKDDRLYNLQTFDDRLTQLSAKADALEEKREAAMQQFDTVTRSVIMDEIDVKYQEKLAGQKQTCEALLAEETELSQKLADLKTDAASRFGAYIGTENMTHDRLLKLCALLESGEANSIAEAVEKLKK